MTRAVRAYGVESLEIFSQPADEGPPHASRDPGCRVDCGQVRLIEGARLGLYFLAGFLWAALRGCELQETVDTASAVAALKCSMWGDIALVTAQEVQEVLAGGPAVRR